MPVRIPQSLPAIEILRQECPSIFDSGASARSKSMSLHIGLLNLMPMKITTEVDFLRILSRMEFDIDLTLLKIKNHTPKHTPAEHMTRFYKTLDEVADKKFDALIITGAPLEMMDFEEVRYWDELRGIFDWARENVSSTLYICWAAQAGLYHFYNVSKRILPRKRFGIFEQEILFPEKALFRGFGKKFNMPQSRHTQVDDSAIAKCPELEILASNPASGSGIVWAGEGREIFITGHLEYAPLTLDSEYRRDLGKRDDVDLPVNYYINDNQEDGVKECWKEGTEQFYRNWLRYYVAPKAGQRQKE